LISGAMKTLARLLLLAVSVMPLLAACGHVPQPFRGTAKVTKDDPLVDVPTAVGVAILPVDGLPRPVSDELTAAIADQLQAMEIPAAAVPRMGGLGFMVSGYAAGVKGTPGGRTFDVAWTLKGRDGRIVEKFVQSARISQGPDGVRSAAAAAARSIAAAMGLYDGPVQTGQSYKAAEESPYPSISVKPAEGAPGDGRQSLALAVLQALSDAGAHRDDVNPDVTLFCKVATTPTDLESQQVVITWRAVLRDGRELGTVKVENVVPNGALDGSWGPTAFAIAGAAQQDLLRLIAAPPPQTGTSPKSDAKPRTKPQTKLKSAPAPAKRKPKPKAKQGIKKSQTKRS
jgi:hypothetical protein